MFNQILELQKQLFTGVLQNGCLEKFRLATFFIQVFFHKHSQNTGQLGKVEAIFFNHLHHLHPFHRHLDISRVITEDSVPLHIVSYQTRIGNPWFPRESRQPQKEDSVTSIFFFFEFCKRFQSTFGPIFLELF